MRTVQLLFVILGCTAALVIVAVLVLRMMLRRFFRQLGKDAKGVADSIGYMARMGRAAGKDMDEEDEEESRH